MKRRFKILAVVVVAIIALVWLSLPSSNPRRAVAAYKAQLIAKGEKLTTAELAPPSSPEGIAAGKKLTNLVNSYLRPADYPTPMKFIAPGVAMIGHLNIEPGLMTGYASNLAKGAELREILNTPALEFDLDYSQGSEMMLLHLAQAKSASVLISIASLQALHEGDYAAAWTNLTTGADLSRLWRDEPLMISELVRVAMARIVLAATWDALQENQWSDAQLADLQERWEEIDVLKQLPKIAEMERAFGIDALAKERNWNYDKFVAVYSLGSSSGSGNGDEDDGIVGKLKYQFGRALFPYTVWKWKTSGSYRAELFDLQMADADINTSRLIESNRTFLPAVNEYQKRIDPLSEQLSQLAPDVDMMGPFVFSVADARIHYFKRVADAETARRLLVTTLALKRYRLRHGTYPTALNELVPEYLKHVPNDPWDGKPLRYRLKPEEDFVLYSVGEDGKDDGGDATRNETGTKTDWVNGRDVVWPRAATATEAGNFMRGQPKSNGTVDKGLSK